MEYPAAPRVDTVELLHGQPIADPYRWLEDTTDPRTETWSAAQDQLFTAHRDRWAGRDWLRARLSELLAVGDISVPVWRGQRHFLVRREGDQEHGVLLVVEPDGRERILVDPMAVDPTGATTLDHWSPSKEGDRLAYLLSTGGTEQSVIRVLDVGTGHQVDGPIDRAPYSSLAWLPGGDEFLYTRYVEPATVRPDNPQLHKRVWRHRIGTDPAGDELIFGADARRGIGFDLVTARDGRWLALSGQQGTDPRNDLWLADLHAAELTLVPVQSNVDARTWLTFGSRGDRGYLWTNRDAPRYRLCTVSLGNPTEEKWEELIPEDPEAVLEDFAVLDDAGQILVAWSRHAVSELTVHDLSTGERLHRLELPGLGTVGHLRSRPEGGHEAWLSYTDFVTPQQVLRYDANRGELSVWAHPPGDRPAPAVVTRQATYESLDGTPVGLFVMAAGEPDTPRPTILYGYGGFNIPQVPQFNPSLVAWVEAGGVYAVANLRGGSEEGEEWHRAGMLAFKQNVFDDFHAAADYLISEGWTTTGQLGIYGGSNGGLLVGAALTQRPDRYAAVVCAAPLLDMLRYEHFGLGPLWTGEYGSVSDPEQFGWLRAYSPYHNVRTGVPYPAVQFTVFEGDNRVDPLHGRKLAALLQYATTGSAPILVRREHEVGHAGRSVTRARELVVDRLAFLADVLHLAVPET